MSHENGPSKISCLVLLPQSKASIATKPDRSGGSGNVTDV